MTKAVWKVAVQNIGRHNRRGSSGGYEPRPYEVYKQTTAAKKMNVSEIGNAHGLCRAFSEKAVIAVGFNERFVNRPYEIVPNRKIA